MWFPGEECCKTTCGAQFPVTSALLVSGQVRHSSHRGIIEELLCVYNGCCCDIAAAGGSVESEQTELGLAGAGHGSHHLSGPGSCHGLVIVRFSPLFQPQSADESRLQQPTSVLELQRSQHSQA